MATRRLIATKSLEQTEYLKLVHRYLSQARELEKLAGADKIIRIETCDSANAGELLRIIGYRMRGGCGSEVVLETVNATRAFLTTDSGFPLAELEQALRTNRPFTLRLSPVPGSGAVRLRTTGFPPKKRRAATSWKHSSAIRRCAGFIWVFPSWIRKQPTSCARTIPMPRLKAYAHVLDFFGGMFEIRDGKAVVPGWRAVRGGLGRAGGCSAGSRRGLSSTS